MSDKLELKRQLLDLKREKLRRTILGDLKRFARKVPIPGAPLAERDNPLVTLDNTPSPSERGAMSDEYGAGSAAGGGLRSEGGGGLPFILDSKVPTNPDAQSYEKLKDKFLKIHNLPLEINSLNPPLLNEDELLPDPLCDTFVEPAEHHDLILTELQNAVEGGCKNIALFLPPGSAKTTYASVLFSAWFMGRFSNSNVIHCTYGTDFSRKVARRIRALCKTEEYQGLTNVKFVQGNDAVLDWSLTNGSTFLGGGIASGITGNRADLVIIDDPVKGREQADSELQRNTVWDGYKDDVLSRKKPGCVEVLIMTRWHEDDLGGRILGEEWKGESGSYVTPQGVEWNVIRIPAKADRADDPLGRPLGEYLWPEWFTPEYWEDIIKRQDDRTINSLYQQLPRSEEGTFLKREWFKRYSLDDLPTRLSSFGASDYAVTEGGGDFTELGVAGFNEEEDMYIYDWWSGQEAPDTWINEQLALIRAHEPFAWVAEGGPIRRSIEPFLVKEMRIQSTYCRLEWITSIANKAANARAFQALASQGKVYIPYTDWGDALLNQLISFPSGKFDDKVDVCGLFGRLLDMAYGPRTVTPTQRTTKDAYGHTTSDYWEEEGDDGNWKTN